MDIKEAITNIFSLSTCGEKHVKISKKLITFIESQQETIESLKCCGNCIIDGISLECEYCTREEDNIKIPKDNHYDNWQPIK